MGRQLTVSRRGEGAPIDAMLWLLEPDVRLVDSRSFTSLAEFTAWLRGASDVTVSWTDDLKADTELAIAVAEVLGAAPGDTHLPTVDGTHGESLIPASPVRNGRGAGNVPETPATLPNGATLDSGRPRGRRHRR